MKKYSLLIAPLVFALVFPVQAWADGAIGPGGGDGYYHMWGGGMIFGPMMMFLFFILRVVAIVLIVRWLAGATSTPPANMPKSALNILDERFAHGEIEQEEYESRKRTLSS